MNRPVLVIITLIFLLSNRLFANYDSIIDWKILATAETLDLYMNNQVAGLMSHNCNVDSGKKLISVESHLDINSASGGSAAVPAMRLQEYRYYSFEGILDSARQILESPAGKSIWSLQKKKSDWILTVTTGGVANVQHASNVNERLSSLYLLTKSVLDSSAKVGDEWNDTSFEMMSNSPVYTNTILKERPSVKNGNKWVFSSTDNIINREERWEMDKTGKTLLREIPPLFVAKVHDKNVSTKGVMNANVFEAFSISATRPAAIDEYIAIGIDSSILDSSVMPFYTLINRKWVLNKVTDGCLAGVVKGAFPDSLKRYLVSTVTMQVDNTLIRGLARYTADKEKQVCKIIGKLTNHVYSRLQKKNTATFSSALETLNAGFGDCGEHAVLLAALLRANKIPSRVLLGLVYVPGRGYLYHAWVMAWAGEWVFADAALGAFPASVNRIPLLIDDTGEKAGVLSRYIGRSSVSYVKRGN